MRLLYDFMGKDTREFLGWSVSAVGDLNKDGFADMLVGAIDHDEGGVELGGAFVFAGNDLYLQATATDTGTGRTVTLDTRGGPPGALGLLYLTQPVGPVFLKGGRLDTDGDWSVTFNAPPSTWGLPFTFQSYAGPRWIDSSPATVTIPP